MANIHPTSSQPEDARASLTSRLIPTMALSTATNPLTAPLQPIASTTPQERALTRFAVHGNAVLTGGAGTLALASARALLEHGVSNLALMDLPSTFATSTHRIMQLVTDFPNVSIHQIPVDVTSETAVAEAMAIAYAKMGNRIDTICCFAGIVGCVHSLDAQAAVFRRVLDVNLTGSFLCAQAAARLMIAQQKPSSSSSSSSSTTIDTPQAPTSPMPGTSILFVSSISAHATNYPQPQASYNASKTAILSLTRSLAAEWAVHGIRVNAVCPGYMDTVLNAGDNLQGVRQVWASRCPMARMGDEEELTGIVVLLSSQRAGRYITGADFVVDGGAMCF